MSKKLKITFLSIVIIGSLFLAYRLYMVYKPRFANTQNNGGQKSAFQNLIPTAQSSESAKNKEEDIFNKLGGKFKDDPDGLYIFEIALDLKPFDSFASWDYKKTPFWSRIKEVDKQNKTLTVQFLSPKSNPLLNQVKKIKVDLCEKEISVTSYDYPSQRFVDREVLVDAKENDDFISFCMDAECSYVGRLCKVYKYDKHTPSQ